MFKLIFLIFVSSDLVIIFNVKVNRGDHFTHISKTIILSLLLNIFMYKHAYYFTIF